MKAVADPIGISGTLFPMEKGINGLRITVKKLRRAGSSSGLPGGIGR